MLHNLKTILSRTNVVNRRHCRIAALSVLVVLVVYVSIARPHVGWGPALTFTSVRPPESMDVMETRNWLSTVAAALVEDGYHDSVLQVFLPGQVFGLVKPVDDMWEHHVRGYLDGRLECEIEISREYLQHLSNDYRADAAYHLTALLDRVGIAWSAREPVCEVVAPDVPANPVSWKHLVFLSPVFQGLLSLDRAVRTA